MILVINTSTLQFALALMEESGAVRAEYCMSSGRGQLNRLMPTLHFLLQSAEVDVRRIKGIVVATGPGSFTGLRVGLSVAKGLCHALEASIIGISSLEALASQIFCTPLPVTPILYSRRGEIYISQFSWSEHDNLLRRKEDVSIKIEELPEFSREQSVFIGNDFPSQAPQITSLLGPRALLAPPHLWNLKASSLGFLGLKRLLAGDVDHPATLSPRYLRPPDIRPNPFNLHR